MKFLAKRSEHYIGTKENSITSISNLIIIFTQIETYIMNENNLPDNMFPVQVLA